MADNWEVGDLALCIKDGTNTKRGQVFNVVWVDGLVFFRSWGDIPDMITTALVFKEIKHPTNTNGYFSSARFIKVTPTEADEFDRETIDLYLEKEKERV